MTQRERILLAVVVGSLLLLVGWKGLGAYQQAIGDRRSKLQKLERDRQRAKLDLLITRQALENLEAWQEKSLPADKQVAQTEYRAWLVERLGDAGLKFNNVRRVGARPEGQAYTALTYMAHAEGRLEQVADFLHAFYNCPQLHKMTVLKLTPLAEEGRLGMDITVEALVVDGAARTEGVVEGASGRLALSDAAEYAASIAARNLFAPYTPPPPPKPDPPPRKVVERPTPPPKPKFDDAKHAHVTAVIGDREGPLAWINVRTTGKTLYLRQGDPLKVGLFEGHVKSIDVKARHILVESEGELLRVPLGSHLREGTPAG